MGIFPHVLRNAKKILIIDNPLYFYRLHQASTSNKTSKTPVHAMERSLIFIERYPMAVNWVSDTMPIILKKAVWFGVSSYTWYNKTNAQKYSQGFKTIHEFFVEHEDEILNSPLIDKPRKFAAKLIIKNHTFPFKLISYLRPAAKKLINMIQGTHKKK